MYGYVMEGGRASLTMRQIGGVWFAVAVLPRSGFLAAYRRGRLLRRLRRQGIVRCVLPSSLTAEAERYGLHGVAVEGLRLALLPQLLDMQGDLRRKTAVLRAEYVSPAVYRAAAVLAGRARYLALEVERGGEELARQLRQRFGLCTGRVGEPAVTVSFSGMPQGEVICLGQDCQRFQQITYALPEGLLEPWPVSEQLLAVLFEAGEIKKEQIRVKTIAPNA